MTSVKTIFGYFNRHNRLDIVCNDEKYVCVDLWSLYSTYTNRTKHQ